MVGLLTISPALAFASVGAVMLGGALQGFSGFGFSLVIVPILSLIFVPAEAVAGAMVLQCLLGIYSCWRTANFINKPIISALVMGAVIGTPVGLWALLSLPESWIRLIIAVLVLGTVVQLRHKTVRHGVPRRSWSTLAGTVSGVMNGVAGLSGPPAVLLLHASTLGVQEIRATLNAFVSIADVIALVPLMAVDKISVFSLGQFTALFPSVWLGWQGGSWLLNRVDARYHRYVAITILGIISILTLASATLGLLK